MSQTPSTGRSFLWAGLFVAIAAPLAYAVQLQIPRLTTPWYLPVLGTLGALLAIAALVKQFGVVRLLVAAVLIVLAGLEWTALLGPTRLPPYTGPVAAGKPFPEFASILADGTPLDRTSLVKDQPVALVFFRGRWCPICMIELRELNARHSDFKDRNVRVVAVSIDDKEDAVKSQTQFPHLTIVADTDEKLTNAAAVLHKQANPDGKDAAAPTTILIDKSGTVRWLFRPEGALRRLSPDELLAAIDRELK